MLGFGFNKDRIRASAEKCVQQGKLQNAIAEYEKITKQDPNDLTIINTIGDLHSRLGQNDRAVECFKKVGDSYAAAGFVPKAIAMYKKLTKLSPSSIESIQKLGELYTQQGLYNDARAQFLAAADAQNRSGNQEAAVKILQRILELDPENASIQLKLADIYVKLNKQKEAKQILTTSAESHHQRGAHKIAHEFLSQLLKIDPQNSRALFLCGQIAYDKGDFPDAIAHCEKITDIDSRADALRVLLNAYIQTARIEDGALIARKLLSVHNDSSGIFAVAERMLSTAPLQALNLYEEFADTLLAANPDTVLEHLRHAMSPVKEDAQALELILRLFQRAGDNSQDAELNELIAHASVQSGDLRRAAEIYLHLAKIEPDNPVHAQSYRQVLVKLGEDPTLIQMPINDVERPLMTIEEPSGAAPLAKIESAVGEDLEEVAEAPADSVTEFSFDVVSGDAAVLSATEPQLADASAPEFSVEHGGDVHEFDIAASFALDAQEGASHAPQVSQVEPEPESAPEPKQSHEPQVVEFDLSDEWEAAAQQSAPRPVPAQSETSVDDLVEEIRFYFSQAMWHEAGYALEKLCSIAPEHPAISEFRQQLDSASAEPEPESIVEAVDEQPVPVELVPESALETPEPEAEFALDLDSEELTAPETPSGPQVEEKVAPSLVEASEPDFAFDLTDASVADGEIILPPAPVVPQTLEPAPAHTGSVLDDFVLDLESQLGSDFDLAAKSPAAQRLETVPGASASASAAATSPALAPQVMEGTQPESSAETGLFSDLLDEFKEDLGDTGEEEEDPETHYNLGVAFKEMGLLDEAIGELQKVCQSVDHGQSFPQIMQAYTWLAHCFVEKEVPEASFRWFQRALNVASDDSTRAAIHYELASAYEMADRKNEALQHFMEVYTTNIDFRDVGERIRALKS